MAREKHEPSDGEIVKARAIAERFGHYSVNEMDRKSQEILVRSYYDNIRGTSISRLNDNQLFRITERLYAQTYNWACRPTSLEVAERTSHSDILSQIAKLRGMIALGADRHEIYDLDESICMEIELKNIPEDGLVASAYNKARNEKNGRFPRVAS